MRLGSSLSIQRPHFILVISLGFILESGFSTGAADPIVTLPSNPDGTIKGKWTSPLCRAFLGVPFAAPPTKDLRWRPPQPVASWTGVKDATKSPPNCLQPLFAATKSMTPGTVVVNGKTAAWPSLHPVMSEDCLYLNVFAPPAPESKAAPKYSVMFYISGGQFQFGGANDNELDGTFTVELGRDVIVVVANSRLGPLGYLGAEALRSRDPNGSTGNYGSLDTRAALKWVQANIGAFHGDPEKVMVFGESGGAGAVTATLMMPGNWGLFNRVLMESGAFAQWGTMTMNQAEGNYDVMVSQTGCKDKFNTPEERVQCLVDLPATEIYNTIGWDSIRPPTQNGFWSCEWSPTTDGVELTAMPMELLEKGMMPPGVQVAFGSNKDEGTSFVSTCSVGTNTINSTCVFEYSPDYPNYVPKTGGHWTYEEKMEYMNALPQPFKRDHDDAAAAADYAFPLGSMFPLIGTQKLLQLWLQTNFAIDFFGGALEKLYLPKASYFTSAFVTESYQQAQHMAGDFSITCPTIRAAKLIAHWSKQDPSLVSNAYMYWFTHTPKRGRLLATPGVKFLGACHGCEIPFAWATPYYLEGQAEYALASVMSGFWRAFSHSGDPNVAPPKPSLPAGYTPEENTLAQKFETARQEHYGSNVAEWPAFNLDEKKNIWFRGKDISQMSDLHAARCEYWDAWMHSKGMPGFSLDVDSTPSTTSSGWLYAGWATAGLLAASIVGYWAYVRNQAPASPQETRPLVSMTQQACAP